MVTTTALAQTAALLGDPARANILTALMDGRALTATELAAAANITPQTASAHLARLTTAGLLAVERQGRHRYHRLATPEVANLLETLMALAATTPARPITVGPRDQALRAARTCYDHLAGQLAVAITDAMINQGHLELSPEAGALTPSGTTFLKTLGIDPPTPTQGGRILCRPCLDWSERRPHLAGALGAALCTSCFTNGWIRRIEGTRALTITPKGRRELRQSFGIG